MFQLENCKSMCKPIYFWEPISFSMKDGNTNLNFQQDIVRNLVEQLKTENWGKEGIAL